MKRSAMALLAALVLVPVVGNGVAIAAPPVAPRIVSVTAEWGMRDWSDGTTRCTLIMNASLDPGITKGRPMFADAHVHFTWVEGGSQTSVDFNYWSTRLARGDTTLHSYTSFMGDGGYYVVDHVRYDLTGPNGNLLSTMGVDTVNTCMNG